MQRTHQDTELKPDTAAHSLFSRTLSMKSFFKKKMKSDEIIYSSSKHCIDPPPPKKNATHTHTDFPYIMVQTRACCLERGYGAEAGRTGQPGPEKRHRHRPTVKLRVSHSQDCLYPPPSPSSEVVIPGGKLSRALYLNKIPRKTPGHRRAPLLYT